MTILDAADLYFPEFIVIVLAIHILFTSNYSRAWSGRAKLMTAMNLSREFSSIVNTILVCAAVHREAVFIALAPAACLFVNVLSSTLPVSLAINLWICHKVRVFANLPMLAYSITTLSVVPVASAIVIYEALYNGVRR